MVYLLHFTRPISRGTSRKGTPLVAGHYLGSADDLDVRLDAHRRGNGARLLQVIGERGITFELARTWEGDRKTERKLKRWKMGPRLCPICQAQKKGGNGR